MVRKKFLYGKKAWLRILEAVIAIMLILSALVIVYSRGIEKPKKSDFVYMTEGRILDEIALNSSLREDIFNNKTDRINDFASTRLYGFNFLVLICEIGDECKTDLKKEEVYSRERIISAILEEYKPRKIKIFAWID